jgi:hypothetical protein
LLLIMIGLFVRASPRVTTGAEVERKNCAACAVQGAFSVVSPVPRSFPL